MKTTRATKPTMTTGPDGRLWASIPQADGPKAVEYDLPGEAGDLLRETAYVAQVVIKRVDGGAITEGDRAHLDPLMADVTELGTHDPDVRDRAATRHFAKARERLAAKATAPKKRTG